MVMGSGKPQNLGSAFAINIKCCQTRGRKREGVTVDLPYVVIVVYLPIQNQSLSAGLLI